jgi:hypothetical protein
VLANLEQTKGEFVSAEELGSLNNRLASSASKFSIFVINLIR